MALACEETVLHKAKAQPDPGPEHHFDFSTRNQFKYDLFLAEAKNLNRGRRLMADKATRGINFLRLTNDFGYYSCAVT